MIFTQNTKNVIHNYCAKLVLSLHFSHVDFIRTAQIMLKLVNEAKNLSESKFTSQECSSDCFSSVQRRSGSVWVGVLPCSSTFRFDSSRIYTRNLIRLPFGILPNTKPSFGTSRKLSSFRCTGSNLLIGLSLEHEVLHIFQIWIP